MSLQRPSGSSGSGNTSSAVSLSAASGRGTWIAGRRSSRPAALQFLDSGQVIQRCQPEVAEKGVGGGPGDRPSRCLAAAFGRDPALLEQHVDRSLAELHASDLLDLAARHRLVVGDDGERLDCRPRQLLLDMPLAGEQRSKIGGGPEGPGGAGSHQMHAPGGVVGRQQREQLTARRRRPAAARPVRAHRVDRRWRTGSPPAAAASDDRTLQARSRLLWPAVRLQVNRPERLVLAQYQRALPDQLENGAEGRCKSRLGHQLAGS